jgi:hypothetical protein
LATQRSGLKVPGGEGKGPHHTGGRPRAAGLWGCEGGGVYGAWDGEMRGDEDEERERQRERGTKRGTGDDGMAEREGRERQRERDGGTLTCLVYLPTATVR